MPDRPEPLDELDITEAFLKGSGPGGQKIVSNAFIASQFLCNDFRGSWLVEQNLIGSTTEAPTYRHSSQSPGDSLTGAEQKDRKADACGKSGRVGEGEGQQEGCGG